jgi:Fic family protein
MWMDLGAIQSKIEHIANSLLAPNFARSLRVLYLARGVHATTAIEGNTLSEEEVRERIEKKTSLPPSQAYLGKEVDNIVEACNAIGRGIFGGRDAGLTVAGIKEFNRKVLDGLPLNEQCVPGEFRNYSVGVAGYRGAPWEDCEFLLGRLCQWLNDELKPPDAEVATGFAVIKAILAHLYIAWIHPFGDGNGRTARLVEFQILLSNGAPSVAAHLLSNFYNQTRAEYYRQLDLASKKPSGPIDFLQYALRGLRDALDEQIKHIRRYQWDVAWRDYVYQKFSGMEGGAAKRRRLVALELAKADPCRVLPSRLRRLTPEIAELYAGKTDKTVTRDLHALEGMKLIRRVGRQVEANGSILTRLLPSRRAREPIESPAAQEDDNVSPLP